MANEGWTNNDTWLKWHGEDKTDSAGLNVFMSSRLLKSENFETVSARSELAKGILESKGAGIYNLVSSKGVQEGDPNAETSVTPAWRKSVVHFSKITQASASPDS